METGRRKIKWAEVQMRDHEKVPYLKPLVFGVMQVRLPGSLGKEV
jgi:hypothetical protein